MKHSIKLTKRLAAIGEEITGDRVFDVGCDHGFLAIDLLLRGRIKSAAALDIAEGPLNKARLNIQSFGLENKIETRLGDGLLPVSPLEARGAGCVIAGMGGMNIINILDENRETAKAFGRLVLSPNRDADSLRRYLHGNGFIIKKERLIIDRGEFYNIINAEPGTERAYGESGYAFGEYLLKTKDPVLLEFVQTEYDKTGRLIDGFRKEFETDPIPGRLVLYYGLCKEALEILV